MLDEWVQQSFIGQTLGSYQIVEEIGEGGMGMVYLAQHPLIGRRAAVKVLLPEFCHNKEVVERFFNEARAATLVKHVGIVDIFDFGYSDEGSAYIVMEYLDGMSIGDRVNETGRLGESEVLRLVRQVASALASVHAVGIIHRDLKPDNIYIVPDSEAAAGERIKVLDFGIAKLTGDAAKGVSKTAAGAVLGSPLYMSPEQCRGAGETDHRADIYAVGCVMYRMACGRPPFVAKGAGELIAKHIYEHSVIPSKLVPELSQAFDTLVTRCLAKDADERFQSMEALIQAIDSASHQRFSTGAGTESPSVSGRALSQAERLAPTRVTADPSDQDSYVYAPDKGRWLRIAAVLGALAAAGVGLALAFSTGSPTAGTAATSALAQEGGVPAVLAVGLGADAAVEPAAAADAAVEPAAAADAPSAAPSQDPTPPQVEFRITSRPRGALVRNPENRVILGETPVTLKVDQASVKHTYLVTQIGYRDAPIHLKGDRSRTKQVTLLRDAGARKKGKPRAPSVRNFNRNKTKRSGFGQTVDPLGAD